MIHIYIYIYIYIHIYKICWLAQKGRVTPRATVAHKKKQKNFVQRHVAHYKNHENNPKHCRVVHNRGNEFFHERHASQHRNKPKLTQKCNPEGQFPLRNHTKRRNSGDVGRLQTRSAGQRAQETCRPPWRPAVSRIGPIAWLPFIYRYNIFNRINTF